MLIHLEVNAFRCLGHLVYQALLSWFVTYLLSLKDEMMQKKGKGSQLLIGEINDLILWQKRLILSQMIPIEENVLFFLLVIHVLTASQ